MYFLSRGLTLVGSVLIFVSLSAAADRPQYILFTRPPGKHWSQSNPRSITAAFLKQPVDAIGSSVSRGGGVLVGNEMIFSVFQSPLATLLQSINATLAAAQSAQVPVSIVLDGQNWWSESGLWNWWDKNATGFNVSNAYNVEWTRPGDPSSAVKIGWRNWGSQKRVTPEQNILSPSVLGMLLPVVRKASALIADWWASLPPTERHLLATVKVGWEAGLQYNAYYYPNGNSMLDSDPHKDPKSGLDWNKPGIGAGLPVLGYAAAHSAGLRLAPGEQLTGEQAALLTRTYVSKLGTAVMDGGIPAELISNHVGGQVPPYHAVPFSAAFASVGTPGWSFYWGVPQNTPLLKEMVAANRTRWAAAEWNPRAKDEATWYTNFKDTLAFLQCEHVAVYNWDNDFENTPNGIAALRKLLEDAHPMYKNTVAV